MSFLVFLQKLFFFSSRHVVRCYLRLTDNPKAREAMRSSLPLPFRDGSFARAAKNDQTTRKCLQQLLAALSVPEPPQ
jgi:CCR4-NOT transcription complex subunit 9